MPAVVRACAVSCCARQPSLCASCQEGGGGEATLGAAPSGRLKRLLFILAFDRRLSWRPSLVPCSLDEQSLALGDHWWSDILSDGIEQHFAGIGLSAASAPGAAPEPAAQPAGDAAATPAGATPEPHSVRIRQHVAPSRPRYEGQLHTTSRRPAARTQRQRRGPEPAGEPAADTAGAPLEPAIGAPAFRSIQQRPSAVARVVGNGHKGRATKSEAFPWKDARKRMRQLKAMWKAGQLTQAVRDS